MSRKIDIPNDIFISTVYQKVLKFLCEHPTSRFYDRQLAGSIEDISVASVNNVLRDLMRIGLVERDREGRQVYNTLNLNHPLVRQFKCFLNALNLFPFFEDLKRISDKIVLYGSAAKGSNTEKSDIDILVVSDSPPGEIQRVVEKHGLEERVQLVIKTRAEYLALKSREPVFYEQVHRGTVYHE